MNYIDIHTHLNFAAFDEDREEVIEELKAEGGGAVNVGTKLSTSQQAVELAKQHENLWATVGLHPIHTDKNFHDGQELGESGEKENSFTSAGEQFAPEAFRELASEESVVAIGECGLDYFRGGEQEIAAQRDAFIAQLHLANELEKPVMLHIRPGDVGDAYSDALDVLDNELENKRELRGNSHFFAGTTDDAKRYLDAGFTISFTGVITFAARYRELVEFVPLDRMHAETDAPYVAPAPYRGKRNQPQYVVEVIKKIAQIKGLPTEVVEEQLVKNAEKLFSFKF